MDTGSAPCYPLARPATGTDPRFSFGLLFDVIGVLAAHGYPPADHPADLTRIQHALFTALYQPTSPQEMNR